MHPALLKLIRLLVKGWIRRQFTGGSARRKIFGALGFILFLFWLGGASLSLAFQKAMTPSEIIGMLPFYLTGFALLPIVFGNEDRAISFAPAEIDFLFAGPFSRRQLVIYKMVRLVIGSAFGGIFFALFLRRFSATIGFAFAGAALALIFINLLVTVVALIRDTIDERRYTWVRRLVVVALLGGVAWIGWSIHGSGLPYREALTQLSESTTARIVTAPSLPFVHIFAAQSLAEFALWCAACAAMSVGAAGLVLALDKGYMEAALTASQRRQARIARLGKPGLGSIPTGKPLRAVRLPAFAGRGPGGAVLRRHLITAVRTSRGWIVMFLVVIAYSVLVSKLTGKAGDNRGNVLAGLIPGAIVLLMMFPQMLRFDFRSDLDHMDWLKVLPASPRTIAFAELATPVLILTILGWAVSGVLAAFLDIPPEVVIMAALAIPPVSILIVGLENFVFLVLPTRQWTPGQASMQFSGRRILMALSRLVLFGIGGGVVGAASVGAWAATKSTAAAYAAGWLTLALIATGVVTAVGWAFARFDVSADMPT